MNLSISLVVIGGSYCALLLYFCHNKKEPEETLLVLKTCFNIQGTYTPRGGTVLSTLRGHCLEHSLKGGTILSPAQLGECFLNHSFYDRSIYHDIICQSRYLMNIAYVDEEDHVFHAVVL